MLALLLLASPALAAPTPAELEALAAGLLPRVARKIGLPAPRALKVKVLAPDAAKAKLAAGLAREYPDHAWKRLGEALIAAGLARPGTDLAQTGPAFYADTAQGFFDPEAGVLYLVDGQPLEAQRAVLAHELAHAVQFAQAGLRDALHLRSPSQDSRLALAALLEGQAQAVAAQVMTELLAEQGVKVPGLPELLAGTRAASAVELAKSAPTPWLGLQLRYPYEAGVKLIAAVATEADPFGRHLLQQPPLSTADVADLTARRARKEREVWGLGLLRRIPGSDRLWQDRLGCAGLDLLGALTGKGPLCEGWISDAVESVQHQGKPVVVWMVRYEKAEQAARLHAALESLGPRPGVELSRLENVVALLSNVPAGGRTSALRAAGQLPKKPVKP